MSGIDAGLDNLGRLDELAAQDTPVHRIDPRAKVITTAVFVVTVASFGRYELVRLAPFLLFPVTLAALGNLPLDYIARRVAVAAPFAAAVGLFNPLLDRSQIVFAGFVMAAGWVSFASIMGRFVLTAAAALILVASTGLHGVCAALSRLGVPQALTVQLLLLYRYAFVLAGEASAMRRAHALRSLGGRTLSMREYTQLLGHLLLRTVARAARVHAAMTCRGFDGRWRYQMRRRLEGRDWAFTIGWCALLTAFRVWNVPLLVGKAFSAVLP